MLNILTNNVKYIDVFIYSYNPCPFINCPNKLMSADESPAPQKNVDHNAENHRIAQIDVEISQSSHLVLEEEDHTKPEEESPE